MLRARPQHPLRISPRIAAFVRASGALLVALTATAAAVRAEHGTRVVSEGYLPAGSVSDGSESQVSPDGRYVVFVVCEDAENCYLASARRFAAPGEVPQTLAGPVHGFSIIFVGAGISFEITGDSRRVVFLASPDEDTEDDLWSVPIDGSAAPVRLNATLLTDEEITDFEITEDGQQVVFELERPGTDALLRVAIEGAGGATVLDEGDDIRSYLFPAASGNPRLLYFIDTDGNNRLEILTIYLSSTLPFPLWAGQLREGSSVFNVEFSPDGDWAVFMADLQVEGVDELWSIGLNSANTVHLLNPTLASGGEVLSFRLSSDGRAVFRADAQVDERIDLWSSPIDDSAAPIKLSGTLVSGGDVQTLGIAGEWAVYIADAVTDGRDELWSVPADGHEAPTRRSDTVPPGRDVFSFRLTPSGNRLVYLANLGPVDELNLHTTSTFGITSHVQLTNRNPFAPNPYSVRSYTVSPDSQRVAFIVSPNADWDGVAMEQSLANPVTNPEILLEVTGADATEYSIGYLPDRHDLLSDARLADGDRREVYLLDEAIFVDGFGSGDRTAWSASVP
jgi:hypothetical protein